MTTLLEKVIMLSDREWEALVEQRRFWTKVDKSGGPDACWPWIGCTDHKAGYGACWLNKKPIRSHRAAYILATGEVLGTLDVVRHKCDNRICCNPAHLETGTAADNIHDRITRKGDQKGENNWVSKLTEAQVYDIRKRVYGGETQKSVAEHYSISAGNVSLIVRGKSWSHSFDASLVPTGNYYWDRIGESVLRKFTPEQVGEIRAEFDTGKVSMSSLIKKHGVTRGTISRIVHRINYRDVP